MSRVFAVEGWGDSDAAFDNLGLQTKEQIVSLLPDDWSWEGKRTLDFGSGAGRTLRHFAAEAEVGEFWGCDMHGPSMEWMDQNLSPVKAWQTTLSPPSGLPHGFFDLIYTVSVFTHLTDHASAWLLELHKVLKPGGILIVSFMGQWTSEYFTGEPWNEDRVGKIDLYHSRDWELGGPAVLISEWWLREHWGRAFDVVDIDQQYMNFSWAVLRKKDVKITTAEIDHPSDDPREIESLRHQVKLLQREIDMERLARATEIEAATAECARALDEQRGLYEGSASWKATAPLRMLKRHRRSG